MRIAYYPIFIDAATLTDRYWRAVHYLAPVANRIEEISFAGDASDLGAPPVYLDQTLASRAAPIAPLLRWASVPDVSSADIVVVWDETRRADSALHGARKIVVLDPRALHEGDVSIEFGAFLAARANAQRENAHARLRAAVAQESAPIAHVFGSGPHLATLDLSGLPPGVSVVCNSVVKDRALMTQLKPRFITAIDPIYHAGPSRHAAAFRAALVEALETHRSWFIIQDRDAYLYESLLPPHLNDLIIPLPVKFAIRPNLDLLNDFWSTATRNVLTLTMLPLAGLLAPEIRLYGCDGRNAAVSGKFWDYAANAAFDAEIAMQHQAHPGFFTLNYQEYYALHCETTRRWIVALERGGHRVFAGAPSHIPALAARRLTDVAALSTPSLAFELAGRAAYARRAAQSAYGALLAEPGVPMWVKSSMRAAVRAARKWQP